MVEESCDVAHKCIEECLRRDISDRNEVSSQRSVKRPSRAAEGSHWHWMLDTEKL